MRTFNQVVTVVALLIMLVLLPIIATIPDAVVQAVQNATFSVEPWVATSAGRVVVGVVAAALWLLTIWLLWREFRRAGDDEIRVTAVEGGRARVASASVAKLLERRVSSISSVRQVTARVRQTREGVVADLQIVTADGVMIPEVTRSAIAEARQALEQEIGAKVADVDVRVREVGLAEARPAVAPPPTAVRPEEEAPPAPIAAPGLEAEPHVEPETAPVAEVAEEPVAAAEEVLAEEFHPEEPIQERESWETPAPEPEETEVLYPDLREPYEEPPSEEAPAAEEGLEAWHPEDEDE
ncbi:MAG: hypothetical protein HPY83_14070 [Anaerolineae bacterium]|nr:hypothetical protein [Anaerolineae bacterium]